MTIKKLLEDCHKGVKEMIVKAAKPSEKIHRIIEQNVLVMLLSAKMEEQNKLYFKNNFINRQMHTFFIKQTHQHNWKNATHFKETYLDFLEVTKLGHKYNADYKKKLDLEM